MIERREREGEREKGRRRDIEREGELRERDVRDRERESERESHRALPYRVCAFVEKLGDIKRKERLITKIMTR